ncbi:hypothetical protein LJC18_00580 [Lachnospiraceae bacterium OttesenSCG-928-E19]|nr:hypothetical protein [Lachnospiraceae bacterium OttesenSCG-928-E19]
MQDFFEDLGKKITKVADDVVKKTGDTVEIQKIKSQIRILDRSDERDFTDMGKIIYDKFRKGEVVDETFISFCEEIERREETREELEKEIENIKGTEL